MQILVILEDTFDDDLSYLIIDYLLSTDGKSHFYSVPRLKCPLGLGSRPGLQPTAAPRSLTIRFSLLLSSLSLSSTKDGYVI